MRGRRPVPPTLAIVRGNPGRRPLNSEEAESVVLKRMPPAPDFLGDEGRKAWSSEGRRLIRAGLLNARFLGSFGTYCIFWEKRSEAAEKLKTEDVVKLGGRGSTYINPYMNVISMCAKAMHQIEVEFGATPASSSKVKSLNPKQKSLFDSLDDPEEGVG